MSKVTRRLIGEDDLEAVADVLSVGFPKRSRCVWREGLHRQSARACPPNAPRFGAILESDGRIVGIVLAFFSTRDGADGPKLCNFSSWYVAPGFETYSLLLPKFLLQDRAATFFNLSPAPHTRNIIKTQGFAPYDWGWFLTVPALRRRRPTAVVTEWVEGADGMGLTPHERGLLDDHRAMGCLCFVVMSDGMSYPYVFSTKRRVARLFAASFLVYCRDIADYGMFAGTLGRVLLRRGIPTVLLDQRCEGRLGPGRLISRRAIKFFRGAAPPRPGDLAYSELVVFDD